MRATLRTRHRGTLTEGTLLITTCRANEGRVPTMNTATPTPAVDEPYLTRRESAAYLKVSVKLMEKLASAGTGPRYFRAGGKLARYRKADLDRWMEEQTFGGGETVPAPRRASK